MITDPPKPERRNPEYPTEPMPIGEPYLPQDPGDEPTRAIKKGDV